MGSVENYIENSRKSYTPIGYVTEEDAAKAVTNAVAEAKQKYADALLESIIRSDAQ